MAHFEYGRWVDWISCIFSSRFCDLVDLVKWNVIFDTTRSFQ